MLPAERQLAILDEISRSIKKLATSDEGRTCLQDINDCTAGFLSCQNIHLTYLCRI